MHLQFEKESEKAPSYLKVAYSGDVQLNCESLAFIKVEGITLK